MKLLSALLSLIVALSFGAERRDLLIARNNVPTGPPWTDSPANYTTGMKVWLQADALITNDASGLLAGWGDSSGNNNRAIQTTNLFKPTVVTNAYGFGNTVRFDGTSNFMHTPSIVIGASGQHWTMVFIGRMRTGTDDSPILNRSTANNSALRLAITATNSIGNFNGSATTEGTIGGALSNQCRFVVMRSTNVLCFLKNNSASNSIAQTSVPTIPFDQIGGYPVFGLFAPIDISEIVVWTNRFLTELELNSLYTNYAKIKYNITLP